MSIIRVKKKKKDFFIALNQPFNDKSISFGARGIMSYLLTKPDDWQLRNYDLYTGSPEKKNRIDGYLKELRDHGYLRRFRASEGRGEIAWISEVYEDRTENPDFTTSDISNIVNTEDDVSSSDTGGYIVSTESVSTESVNNDNTNGKGDFLDSAFKASTEGVSEITGPNPVDAHFGHRDDFVKAFYRYPSHIEKDTIVDLSYEDNADPNKWKSAVEDAVLHKAGGNPSVAWCITVYKHYLKGGTWNTLPAMGEEAKSQEVSEDRLKHYPTKEEIAQIEMELEGGS